MPAQGGQNLLFLFFPQHFPKSIFHVKTKRMKKLFFGICFFLAGHQLMAQAIFKGKIFQKDNSTALAGATVELLTQGSTITNDKGEFSFSRIKPGIYQLRITNIGFQPLSQTVQIQDGVNETSLSLEPSKLFLTPVEIRAIRAGDLAPFTKNQLSKKEIEKENLGRDLPFLLDQTPSVVVNSDAGTGVGYTGIRIRGTDATRINVTLNGIPYNDAESQGTFFVDIPDISSSTNSIQVQRGVGTSSNGAGAFGATINLSTNEFVEKPYGESFNSYGSFNTWKNTLKAGTGLINNHFTVDARVSRISSDGYVDRATSDLKSLYLSAAYIDKNSSLRFNFISGKEKTYQAWYGVPESLLHTDRTFNPAGTEKPGEPYDNETDNYQQDHYQLFFNHEFNKKWSFNTAMFLTRGKGYYEEYRAQQAYADYGLPDYVLGSDTLTTTDLVRQLWLDNYFFGNISSVQYKNQKTSIIVGGGWYRYDGGNYGKLIWGEQGIPKDYKWYDHDSRKTDFNFYAKWQQKIAEHWNAFADLQFRRVDYKIDGFRNNPQLYINNIYNFVNPKLGVSYIKGEWFGYASFAIANKEPNRDDFEAGAQQQPKSEHLMDFELGVEKRNYRFNWGVTMYYMNYDNQLILTGKINDVGAYTRTNIPKSYRTGVELQARWKPSKWVNVSGNFTLSENKVIDFVEYYDDFDNGGQKTSQYSKTDIALSPSAIGAATVNVYPLKGLEIDLIAKYVGRQYLDNTSRTSRSLDPYYVQDARAIYTLPHLLFSEISLVFQVNNLLNKMYEPNGYTYPYYSGGQVVADNYYFPMAGTNFMAAINIKF